MKLPPNFLLVNKPVDWTSFDVVNFIRNRVGRDPTVIPTTHPARHADASHAGGEESLSSFKKGQRSLLAVTSRDDKRKRIKVGHAGTLDPFATGLLIVGCGREATKKLDEFKNLKKTYLATIKLGAVSDTQDLTGTITVCHFERRPPEAAEVEKSLSLFLGKQLQMPPMFSAKKINGHRLYDLARQGKTVERQPSAIEIYNLKILDYTWPLLKIEVECSAGTYIRTLAHDIGAKLCVGAYCEALERTKIGDYKLDEAQNLMLYVDKPCFLWYNY